MDIYSVVSLRLNRREKKHRVVPRRQMHHHILEVSSQLDDRHDLSGVSASGTLTVSVRSHRAHRHPWQVTVLLTCFTADEAASTDNADGQSVINDVIDFNRRFSGAPRSVRTNGTFLFHSRLTSSPSSSFVNIFKIYQCSFLISFDKSSPLTRSAGLTEHES